MPVVNSVARTVVGVSLDVCPVLLMKVVTVCAAAGSGATVARTARTASATATGIGARGTRRAAEANCARAGNRGGRRGALGETSVGAGIVKRRRGSVAVPISVVFVSIVRESPVHGLAGRDHACGLPVAEDFQERTQAIRQQLRFDAANR